MNLLKLDLNLLIVLDALLLEGSTVKAGKRIGLSQPAVSAALQRLRFALDDPLFVRAGQRIVPTDYAKSLAVPLRAALQNIEALLAAPEKFEPRTAHRDIRISGMDFFAEALMPELADRLKLLAPGMRAQLVNLTARDYIAPLEKDEADFVLMPSARVPDWIEIQPLFHVRFVLVARRDHALLRQLGATPGTPLSLDAYCAMDHVLCSPDGSFRTGGDATLEKLGRERRIVMTLPTMTSVCTAVANSDLVGLVPTQLANALAGKLGIETYLTPFDIAMPLICMCWHARSSLNPELKWVRQQMADILMPLNEGLKPIA